MTGLVIMARGAGADRESASVVPVASSFCHHDYQPMFRRYFRDLFRASRSPRFDALFEGGDEDLVLDLVGRIEGPEWQPKNLLSLPGSVAHIVRLCRFDGIFGNGGLQYWFECDSELYGQHTSASLRAVGMTDAAAALDAAYQTFPTPYHYENWGLRMEALKNFAVNFEALEARLWQAHPAVMASTAAYARDHKSDFECLRKTRPWCAARNAFGVA